MNDPKIAAAGAEPDRVRVARLLQRATKAFADGNMDRLKVLLEQILDIDPDHPKALYNLAIVHRDREEIFSAEVYLRHAIKVDPDSIDAYQALGDLLFTVKHLIPAVKIYEDALERAPNRLPLLLNLARTRLLLKEPSETETLARRILAIDENSVQALGDLAWALLYSHGDAAEALAAADTLFRFQPDSAHGLGLREQALVQLGRTGEAQALWQSGLERASEDWSFARPLVEIYYWLSQFDRSRAITMAHIAANPTSAECLRDLAALQMADGEFQEAQGVLERAARIAPDNQIISMLCGLNAFRLGDFRTGLELYGARWHREGYDKPWDIPVAEWDGRPIDGKLLVYCEQGVGDYVMYALLFPQLRAIAKSIVIEVNSRVASLFRRSFPDMRIIDRNALPPDWNPKDYQAKVAMGDLPLRLNVDLENLPSREGFLIPEPGFALKLRKRYQALFPGKRLVGISWRSGNRDSATIRSIDLSSWRPIFETGDCAFISLQYGDVRRDVEALRAETGHVVHCDAEIDPLQYLDPFAAQIAAMDLVISVDNSTVHFAGAIGKPCWVMLPVNSDWRWLIDRPKSVWYDSLELIRQERGAGWEPVIRQVADKLRDIGTDPLVEALGGMCLRCGEDLLRRGIIAQAEEYFRWLLETGRHKEVAFHGIGIAAQKAQHYRDAMLLLGQAAEMAPERVDYRADWSVALYDAGHRDEAERLARDLTRQSNDPTALMAMGQILGAKGLPDQATDYFARVLRSDPAHVVARLVLAALQAAQGDTELAQQNYARLVQHAPDLPAPRMALAEIELRHGREEAAWPNFAWRFGAAPEELPRHLAMMAPDDRPKSWTGGKIRKRRLFLRAERNAVEQMLFAPWFEDALKDSRSILAECDPATLSPLRAAFPDIQFAGAGALAPPKLIHDRIQIAASLGDLVSTYPRVSSGGGWLPFDRAAAASLRARFLADGGNRPVVGLSWRPTGSPGAGLEPFAPLLDVPGIRWLALPVGAAAPTLAQFLSARGGSMIYEPGLLQGGLESMAGGLAALDLLISAEDTAATLAGALGRPVWKIAGAADHWSWLADGTDSKWHRTARIFRAAGDDGRLIAELRGELEKFAGAGA